MFSSFFLFLWFSDEHHGNRNSLPNSIPKNLGYILLKIGLTRKWSLTPFYRYAGYPLQASLIIGDICHDHDQAVFPPVLHGA